MNDRTAILLGGILLLAAPAVAETWPELTEQRETELALSAAPEHLRAEAAVYLLGDRGFQRVRESRNGFTCLVLRGGGVFAPVCYDAEGSRTTLLANLRQAELEASGVEPGRVQQILGEEYESGRLKAPQRPGIAYMLSEHFAAVDPETRETATVYPPHLMFYAPYLTDKDIGAPEDHQRSTRVPWILNPGTPTAYIIVVPPEHQVADVVAPSGS